MVVLWQTLPGVSPGWWSDHGAGVLDRARAGGRTVGGGNRPAGAAVRAVRPLSRSPGRPALRSLTGTAGIWKPTAQPSSHDAGAGGVCILLPASGPWQSDRLGGSRRDLPGVRPTLPAGDGVWLRAAVRSSPGLANPVRTIGRVGDRK